MRILVANDDGIFSPGIKALAFALRELGEVNVVAPDVEQSGVGHSITFRRPLRFKHTASAGFGEIPAYRVDGTPADCVVLGNQLLGRPDVVASGINIGVNMGLDLTHSGTVAAALEGASLGIPSIAFSLDASGEELRFDEAARYAASIVRWVLEHGLPPKTLLNVNFPNRSPLGIRITRLSTHRYEDSVVKRIDPEGRPYYWVAGKPTAELEEGTDFWAVQQGYISVTPITLDYTNHAFAAELRESFRLETPQLG
ncbi:MAG: 5'/3'-nucleotidase SurE [Meiothermus sp.]|uniref:5'/3'-nucleotidase SurE n=1 Tax=Meiothermus sp. TaxID=1955249 RepID=UPI0025CFF995|nr:5'/3'-nucleotidase SurE [Meiothermus sp.]MCS7058424.1 5'/3'-nucleotidase SurE [Meiothermus sp.]MCS7195472.1 5'/3'-nucleotidase SurE [Meiothermus sp.]MCX7741281.1 5'/3'-nucleotidase SurE [Meiothermus sp.]MDW8089788.1 5'/3'-nucleotidase SurE [Meiothermus sp.]MDW8481786.1 5'/3'-nucleotidase SurE [Meiothermus sp.]